MNFTDILNNVPLTWISVAMTAIFVIYKLGMVYLKKQKDKKKVYRSYDDLAAFFDKRINGKLIEIKEEIEIIKKYMKQKGRK